jgi:hypothetical protein
MPPPRTITSANGTTPGVVNPRLQRFFFLLSRSGHRDEAGPDASWLLKNQPPGTDEA